MCQTAGSMPSARERAHAADAEQELLREPHLAAPGVEDVGDRAVGEVVLRHVGVEQEERHAADLRHPDLAPRPRGPAAARDAARSRPVVPAAGRTGRRCEVVLRVDVLLAAVGVDRLAEVAVAVEQADGDERQPEVAGALQVVAGEHAEAAGVERQRLVDAELHREVRDRTAVVARGRAPRTRSSRRPR